MGSSTGSVRHDSRNYDDREHRKGDGNQPVVFDHESLKPTRRPRSRLVQDDEDEEGDVSSRGGQAEDRPVDAARVGRVDVTARCAVDFQRWRRRRMCGRFARPTGAAVTGSSTPHAAPAKATRKVWSLIVCTKAAAAYGHRPSAERGHFTRPGLLDAQVACAEDTDADGEPYGEPEKRASGRGAGAEGGHQTMWFVEGDGRDGHLYAGGVRGRRVFSACRQEHELRDALGVPIGTPRGHNRAGLADRRVTGQRSGNGRA